MSNDNGKLPDFIICGFQKCGTSALGINLSQHPKVNITRTNHEKAQISGGKEFNFFCDDRTSTYYEGIDWYKSHFKQNGSLWGEVSPNYGTWHTNPNFIGTVPDVLDNMKKHLKNTKIIFSLRNPIYRAYSAYNHYMQLISENIKFGAWKPDKSFIWNFENYETAFDRDYIFCIKKYESAFTRKLIHIVNQEKLKSDEFQSEYDKLFNFLNVKSHPIINKPSHIRTYKVPISKKEIEFLKDFYKTSVQNLFDYLGYEIKEWTEFC